MSDKVPLSENTDYSKFSVDLSFLEKERPIGVTGLLRVKNDAEFIDLCIESCIDALDELVITYQVCDDDAPKIIEEKRRQYPHKIKTYFYEPSILSHNLSKDEIELVRKMPKDSIHLMSNYYNYALSKVSYRYVVKIDTDQIYFSDKLKEICDAYRNTSQQNITIKEYIAYNSIIWLRRAYNLFPSSYFIPFKRIVETYRKFVLKKIINEKVMLSVSGINLFYDNDRWSIPLGNNENGIRSPFNGVGDTLFFAINKDTYYVPWEYYNKKKSLYFYYEIFHKMEQDILYGGFLWFHLDAIRKDRYWENKKYYTGNVMDITEFFSRKKVVHLNRDLFMKSFRYYYYVLFEYEKKGIPLKELNNIKKYLVDLGVLSQGT